GVTECLRALLEDLLADGPVAQQLLAARQVRLGENDVRFRSLEIGAGLVEGVLERPLVDGEQQVALLHDLAVAEVDLIEVARYARAHLDDVHQDEAADIFVLIHDGALRGLGHRHLRWRRRRLLLAFAAACKQARQGNRNGSQDWGRCRRHEVGLKDHEKWRLYMGSTVATHGGLALVNAGRALPSRAAHPISGGEPQVYPSLSHAPDHPRTPHGSPP